LSRSLIAALLAAIGIATLHAVHLSEPPRAGELTGQKELGGLLIGILAIVLPPMGTAFLSIRSMYNFRARTRIYEHERGLLRRHRGTLEALVAEAKESHLGTNVRKPEEIDFDFRAAALRTEQSLSLELEQWMLLMERDEHELSP